MIIVSEAYAPKLHVYTDELSYVGHVDVPLREFKPRGMFRRVDRHLSMMSVVSFGEGLVVCGLYEILELNPFRLVDGRVEAKVSRRITSPWMNDIHFVDPLGETLLVTNTGFDEVVEINWDGSKTRGGFYWNCDRAGYGPVLASWLRDNRGYDHTTADVHQVHVNYAKKLKKDRYLLCLFKQHRDAYAGEVLLVDHKGREIDKFVHETLEYAHCPVFASDGNGIMVCSSYQDKILYLSWKHTLSGVIKNMGFCKCIARFGDDHLVTDSALKRLIHVRGPVGDHVVEPRFLDYEPYWVCVKGDKDVSTTLSGPAD